MIVCLFHVGVLARERLADGRGYYVAFHRFLVFGDGRIFAPLALSQDGMIVLTRDRRFQIDPGAMHCSSRAAAVFRIMFAKTDRLVLELTGKFCTLERVLIEKRFELRIFHGFRRLTKSLLAVFQRLDQAVDGGNNFFLLTHSTVNTDSSGTSRGYFSWKICGRGARP